MVGAGSLVLGGGLARTPPEGQGRVACPSACLPGVVNGVSREHYLRYRQCDGGGDEGPLVGPDRSRGRSACLVGVELLDVQLDHVLVRGYPLRLGRSLWGARGNRSERAEEAMCLVEDACGEVHSVGGAARLTVADLQRPQTVDRDGLAVRIRECAEVDSGERVVGEDAPALEVTHEQHLVAAGGGEASEARGRVRQAPRRVKRPAGDQANS